jgi:pre-mRNA cleavage complex 2 protein Pcf11
MAYDPSAAEVAEDYRRALEDLTSNLRYEISNLTLIARENTEHALTIADVLQEHIMKVGLNFTIPLYSTQNTKGGGGCEGLNSHNSFFLAIMPHVIFYLCIQQAPPHKKLPALYVLDSIIKNVGTPYTLFFARKLYQTFMESYASVDGNVRRKMDEMLKTWKEPVPGSLDTRPVFPPDVVRPIENALIKARTSALQAQQERMQQQNFLGRPRPAAPYRETPTPPGMRPNPAAVAYQQQQPLQNMQNMNGGRPPSEPISQHQHMPYPVRFQP